jgi:hypothetical protein
MDVTLDVYRGHTIVQRGALIQQSLTKGSQTCSACIGGARADAQISPEQSAAVSQKRQYFGMGRIRMKMA